MIYIQKFVCSACQTHHGLGPEYANHAGYPCPKCGTYLAWPTPAQKNSYKAFDTIGMSSQIIGLHLFFSGIFVFKSWLMTVSVVIAFLGTSWWLSRTRPAPIELPVIDEIYPAEERARLIEVAAANSNIAANIAAYEQAQRERKANKIWWQFWI